MLELLRWIALRPRSYTDAIEAWRSSCPRHPVWDDAFHDGLICVERGAGKDGSTVALTPRGRALLDSHESNQVEVMPRAEPVSAASRL
jgi:hypothetical protein